MMQDKMKIEKQLIDTQYENTILKNRIKLCEKYINSIKFFSPVNSDTRKLIELITNMEKDIKKILKGDDYE